jgi:hypothetical protein
MLPPERWALTPPFHPYRAASPSAIRLRGLLSGRLKVFLQMATEARCTGGLFSVALSVAENLASLARTARRSRPPGVTRRVAPWSFPRRAPDFHPEQQARRPRCPDFPPGQLSCESRPSDHPAHPPTASISLAPKWRARNRTQAANDKRICGIVFVVEFQRAKDTRVPPNGVGRHSRTMQGDNSGTTLNFPRLRQSSAASPCIP